MINDTPWLESYWNLTLFPTWFEHVLFSKFPDMINILELSFIRYYSEATSRSWVLENSFTSIFIWETSCNLHNKKHWCVLLSFYFSSFITTRKAPAFPSLGVNITNVYFYVPLYIDIEIRYNCIFLCIWNISTLYLTALY